MFKLYDIKVISETESSFREQFFCDLCGFILSGKDDTESHSDNGCCHECFLTFCESRKKEWDEGWRPEKSVIEEYVHNRKRLIIKSDERLEII